MQTTRRDLLDEFVDLTGAPNDATVRNTTERMLNRALERVWMRHPWRQFVLPTPWALATVAGQRSYALPEYFGRIASTDGGVRNVTSGGAVWPTDPDRARDSDPAQGTTTETRGRPSNYYVDGTWSVQAQPGTSGEALEVVSDSAADVAVRVFVEGEDTNHQWRQVQVVLTGTVAVSVGTFVPDVTGFGKAYAEGATATTEFTSSVGTVTLRIVGGATLQTLGPYESAREHRVLSLVPVPDAVYSLAVPIARRPRPLVYDSDPIPLLWGPALIEDMLIWQRIGANKLTLDSRVPRPALDDLIHHDNSTRPPTARRPWAG